MGYDFTKESKDFWKFLELNKGNEVNAVSKEVEAGKYSKDLYLLERDEDYTFDGAYHGFYLLDELAENDHFHELLTYLLSIYETAPTDKQLERALQMAVVHGALKNTKLLVDKGAVPNKQTLAAPAYSGTVSIYDFLEENFKELIKTHRTYLLEEADRDIANGTVDYPENSKTIREKIKRIRI